MANGCTSRFDDGYGSDTCQRRNAHQGGRDAGGASQNYLATETGIVVHADGATPTWGRRWTDSGPVQSVIVVDPGAIPVTVNDLPKANRPVGSGVGVGDGVGVGVPTESPWRSTASGPPIAYTCAIVGSPVVAR